MTADWQPPDAFTDLDPSPRDVLAALTPDDWAELAALVDQLSAHTGSFGESVPPKRTGENTFEMGYSVTGPLLDRALPFIRDHQLVLRGFSLRGWEERPRLHGEDATAISDLTVEQTLGVITGNVRGGRFAEGGLVAAFDKGAMPKLFAHLLDFAPETASTTTGNEDP